MPLTAEKLDEQGRHLHFVVAERGPLHKISLFSDPPSNAVTRNEAVFAAGHYDFSHCRRRRCRRTRMQCLPYNVIHCDNRYYPVPFSSWYGVGDASVVVPD